MTKSMHARTMQLLASVAIGAVIVTASPLIGAWPQTAQAQVTISAEFRTVLSPYGRWQRHPRWGEVWIVNRPAQDWRPYTRGRWVYTDDWGYYWDTDTEESDWGWVAYHYGRWVNDPGMGWIWIPGDDWAPAWVDWRRGEEYVGWAPLPPDDFLVEYRDDPVYWSFVRPRYLLAPRVFLVFVPPRDRVIIFRRTVIVNRTLIVDRRDGNRPRGRIAINAGIDPGLIAKAQGKPIRAAKVEPVVLAGTKVDGGKEVKPGEGKRLRATVKETNTVIKPTDKVAPPKELGANEKGRLGDRPPKAARNAGGADNDRRSGDRGKSPPPPPPPPAVNERGRSGDSRRPTSPPPPAANERRRDDQRGNRGDNQDNRRGQQNERRREDGARSIQSPPPPPPAVRRSPPPPPPPPPRVSPPPPPPRVSSPPPPPPAANERRREERDNRPPPNKKKLPDDDKQRGR